LATVLDSNTNNFTIFAPTDQAFINLFGAGNSVTLNRDVLTDLLLYHGIANQIIEESDIARCDQTYVMANNGTTVVYV
jgi:uncharacterized surface protein with fasciclin (FAS1) repeats